MPLYISLIRYTQKGVENLKDSPKQVDATKKAFEAAGGKLKAIYWTLGQYDYSSNQCDGSRGSPPQFSFQLV